MPKRVSVNAKGFTHKHPLPSACRKGNFLFSSVILGRDPATGKPAETLESQCALIFRHMREIVETGGGTVEDIVRVTFWMRDRENRDCVNTEWLRMFPDPESRPARQSINAPDLDVLIKAEFIAIID